MEAVMEGCGFAASIVTLAEKLIEIADRLHEHLSSPGIPLDQQLRTQLRGFSELLKSIEDQCLRTNAPTRGHELLRGELQLAQNDMTAYENSLKNIEASGSDWLIDKTLKVFKRRGNKEKLLNGLSHAVTHHRNHLNTRLFLMNLVANERQSNETERQLNEIKDHILQLSQVAQAGARDVSKALHLLEKVEKDLKQGSVELEDLRELVMAVKRVLPNKAIGYDEEEDLSNPFENLQDD